METLQSFQWEIFIFLEVGSWLFLLVFLLLRYAFDKVNLSRLFLGLFLLFILFEGLLAYLIYRQTGEIDTFQVVIIIFIIYACTFGVGDFKKLDRYIKVKVGKWRKVDLLTEKDKAVMAKLKDPRAIARKNRMWSYVHTAIFIMANIIFWQLYGNDAHAFLHYVKDWSWYEDVGIEHAPYTNEMVMNAVKLWIIIYAVDTVVAWSYTLFPAEEKGE